MLPSLPYRLQLLSSGVALHAICSNSISLLMSRDSIFNAKVDLQVATWRRSLYGGKRNPSRYLRRWVSDWGVGTSVFIHEQVMRSALKTFLEILSLIEMLRTPWQGSLVVMVFFASRRSLYSHLPSHTTPCILFPFPFFCSLTHVLLLSLASWSSWFSFHLC